MTTATRIYRDGIANWIERRTSAGRDLITSVETTYVQKRGLEQREFRIRKSERTSFPAIKLLLGKGFFPITLWLVVRGNQLLVWLARNDGYSRCWPAREPLADLEFDDAEFFDHLAQVLQRFDVELPDFDVEPDGQGDTESVSRRKPSRSRPVPDPHYSIPDSLILR